MYKEDYSFFWPPKPTQPHVETRRKAYPKKSMRINKKLQERKAVTNPLSYIERELLVT